MKAKLSGCIGLIILVLVLVCSPFGNEPKEGDFSLWLRHMGDEQAQYSEEVTDEAISKVEEPLTGGHKVDGSNWAIPNIIAYWLGGR